jgi:hypothetical protein
MMEKRKNQVRVKMPPVDDGHSWRKYGQKEILGAKHPRLALVTHLNPSLFFSLPLSLGAQSTCTCYFAT